jgi:YHS domain-containing protein
MIKLRFSLVLGLVAVFATASAEAGKKQTICPVTGDALGGDNGPPIPYADHGQTILFCCKSCVKKYVANPAKYAAEVKKATGR